MGAGADGSKAGKNRLCKQPVTKPPRTIRGCRTRSRQNRIGKKDVSQSRCGMRSAPLVNVRPRRSGPHCHGHTTGIRALPNGRLWPRCSCHPIGGKRIAMAIRPANARYRTAARAVRQQLPSHRRQTHRHGHTARLRALPNGREAAHERRASCRFYSEIARPPEDFRADWLRGEIAGAGEAPPERFIRGASSRRTPYCSSSA